MKHILLSLLILGAVCTVGCRSDPDQTSPPPLRQPREAQRLMGEATRQIDAGRLERAQALLETAVRADPMHGPAHNNLGLVLFERGELYRAAWKFQAAAKLMPNQVPPRNNLGLVLESARRFDDAIEAYREALAIEPERIEVLGNLTRARLRRGDRDADMLEALSDLVLKHPDPTWRAWAGRQAATLTSPNP